jgi:ribosomal-protein-alanine N-acetyltransferase
MKIHIETARLFLRDIQMEDAHDMFEMDSDPEVHRYLGNKPQKDIKEAESVIKFLHRQYAENGIGRWAVVRKDSGEFIGWCGLKWMNEMTINGMTNFYDLGYRYKKSQWGRGFGWEAAQACAKYAFEEMKVKELYGFAHEDNEGSRRILKKVGLQEGGIFSLEGDPFYWYKGIRKNVLG